MSEDAVALQRRYYAETAADYDTLHVAEADEHYWALGKLLGLVDETGAGSVLDVGTGTGRALEWLRERRPDLRVHGVEPVPELLEQATSRHGVAPDCLTVASGDRLPFADGAFDVVCELGVLHHVPDPAPVVAEMLRVARRGVVLSDTNRFGHGRPAARLAKLGLARAGLWPLAFRATHRGKPYWWSAGDGVHYSYSVFDSLPAIGAWAAEVQLLAPAHTSSRLGSWAHPLLTSSHVVVVATRG